jgi:hypothetical protein
LKGVAFLVGWRWLTVVGLGIEGGGLLSEVGNKDIEGRLSMVFDLLIDRGGLSEAVDLFIEGERLGERLSNFVDLSMHFVSKQVVGL